MHFVRGLLQRLCRRGKGHSSSGGGGGAAAAVVCVGLETDVFIYDASMLREYSALAARGALAFVEEARPAPVSATISAPRSTIAAQTPRSWYVAAAARAGREANA